MQIRDRVRELRRVRAGDLKPNPANWRTHSKAQADALRGALAEIGYASALLARELDDGSLMLVDGHLRADTTPDVMVPVLVLDVTEDEAKKLLATLDPLSAMASADTAKLDALLREVSTGSEALASMLTSLAEEHGVVPVEDEALASPDDTPTETPLPTKFEVLVECGSEADQKDLYDRLTAEGRTCRVLSL